MAIRLISVLQFAFCILILAYSVHSLVFISLLCADSSANQFNKFTLLPIDAERYGTFCLENELLLPIYYQGNNCTSLLSYMYAHYAVGHDPIYYSKEVFVLLNNDNSIDMLEHASTVAEVKLNGNLLNVLVESYGVWDGTVEVELYQWLFNANERKQWTTIQHVMKHCGKHVEMLGDYVNVRMMCAFCLVWYYTYILVC